MQFFGKIDLIDGIESQKDATATSVTLKTLEIGQLYSSSTDGSVLEVKWFKNGSEVSSLADLVEWTMPTRDAQGSWKVEVQFKSPEIRKNFSRFADSATISL